MTERVAGSEESSLPNVDLILPIAVRVASTLGLADLIASGTNRLQELADESSADREALRRLLRYLVSHGVFSQSEGGEFQLTTTARLLLLSRPQRDALNLESVNGRITLAIVNGLLQAVRKGEPVWADLYGRRFYEDLNTNPLAPPDLDVFIPLTPDEVYGELRNYVDWDSMDHVVDVGGGSGGLLKNLLRAFPTLRGTLIDLPKTIERARTNFAATDLRDRCKLVASSFFDPLPRGADAYVLSGILSDWSDRDAVTILYRCREAAGGKGQVLIRENLVAVDQSQSVEGGEELFQLVVTGGRTRTEEEIYTLCAEAHMEVVSSRRMPSGRYLFDCKAYDR